MASIMYLLGKARPKSSTGQPLERKRLRRKGRAAMPEVKLPPISEGNVKDSYHHNTLSLDNGVLNVDLDRSYMEFVVQSDHKMAPVNEEEPTSLEPPTKVIVHQPSILSDDSASFYSIDEMQYAEFKRTRPKTPVLMIGQLERISEQKWDDKSRLLAGEYQAILPLRTLSPSPPIRHQQKLRKIKCQVSLRDLIKAQPGCAESPGMDSEGETLVDSEPGTPAMKSYEMPRYIPSYSVESEPEVNTDIGIKICTNLLSNELASAFSKQDPVRDCDRTSELQILLMIESYEMVQKQLQEKKSNSHVIDGHVDSFEEILDHWLHILYNVYDKLQEEKRHEDTVGLEWLYKSSSPFRLSTAGTFS